VLAFGGDRQDVVDALEQFFEDLIDFEELFLGTAGRILEQLDNPLNRLAANHAAKTIAKTWRRLSKDERTAWLTRLAEQLAQSQAA